MSHFVTVDNVPVAAFHLETGLKRVVGA